MAKRELPSPEVLRQLLRYEPETGKLFWKERGPEWFEGGKICSCRGWNTRFAMTEAFTALTAGYRSGAVLGVPVYAHRVAWAIVFGAWPVGDIDHFNHDKTDNRLCNLSDVSASDNMKNQSLRIDNLSGQTGVSWSGQRGMWCVKVKASGRSYHGGFFMNIDEAIDAAVSAHNSLGFHPNHGRRAGEFSGRPPVTVA